MIYLGCSFKEYRLIWVNWRYYRLLQVTTGYYMLLKVTTGYLRLLHVTTGYYKQTFQADKWLEIKQFNANYCLIIYWGCSFKEYLVIHNSIIMYLVQLMWLFCSLKMEPDWNNIEQFSSSASQRATITHYLYRATSCLIGWSSLRGGTLEHSTLYTVHCSVYSVQHTIHTEWSNNQPLPWHGSSVRQNTVIWVT